MFSDMGQPFIRIGPEGFDSSVGFSSQNWQQMIRILLGPKSRVKVLEIGLSGDGTTVWSVEGLGETWTIKPDLGIAFPVEGVIGPNHSITIKARSDGTTTVYPMCWVSGGYV